MVDRYLKKFFPFEPLDDDKPAEREPIELTTAFTKSFITEKGTGRRTVAFVRGEEVKPVWTRKYCRQKIEKIWAGEVDEDKADAQVTEFLNRHIEGTDPMLKAWATECRKVYTEVYTEVFSNPRPEPQQEPEKPKPAFKFSKPAEPEKPKFTFKKPAPPPQKPSLFGRKAP